MNALKAFAPLIGLVFGAILLGFGIINLSGSVASASWLPERGVVTRAVVETSGTRDRTTTPTIEYRYTRHDTTYTGTRIRYGLVTAPASARALVSRYRVGDTVTVYVNPRDPTKSVLQHNGLIIPIAETIAGILLLSLWVRKPQDTKNTKPRSGREPETIAT